MSKPNILEILPLISEVGADGPTYSVTRLCQSLINLHLNIQLANCATNNLNQLPDFIKRFPLGIGPTKLCRTPDMYKWIKQLAENNKIDLIHSHGLWTMPNIYPALIALKFDIPHIISPRGSLAPWAMQSGSFAKKIFWPLYQKSALKNANCLHATSIAEYHDIRNMGFTNPVALIPNGIDIPEYSKQPTENLRTLLFLGRINPIKGLDILLKAWQQVQDKFPNWQLEIAGPDSRGYLNTIKQMVSDLRLERVKFSGLLVGAAKLKAYQNAELFILPSYTENFGMVAAEALASGTAVIASRGTPWSGLEKNQCGWWVDTNVSALANSLENAFSKSANELIEMGLNGRQWMINDFSWGQISQMMKETYLWLINGTKPPKCILFD